MATTHTELITRLQVTQRAILAVMGWDTSDPIFHEIATETLQVYGVDAWESVTDIGKVNTIGRYLLMKYALDALALNYDFSDGGASYSRSQAYKMVSERYEEALTEAMPYLSTYKIGVQPIVKDDDVYRIDTTEDEFAE